MSLRDSRVEYERRMHRVVEYIDGHLADPLDLPTLAAVAHFSPFHFHRLFRAWMGGETLGDYLRRRRVEKAAQRLVVQPGLSVLEAALGAGFGSGEAFARAFRQRFGAAPSAWRRQQRKNGQALRKIDQDGAAGDAEHGLSQPPPPETPMNVTLVDRPATRVAFLRHTGPYGEPVGRFYAEQVYPWMVRHGLLGRVRYGIAHDDPLVTAPEQCRYDACAEIPGDAPVSSTMLTTTIPAGRYASLPFKGTSAEIDAVWQRLVREWLPDSGLQLADGPCFEHYPVDACHDDKTGVFDCHLCVPVQPL
jgi:AraC family transcriptional regulator